MKRSVRLSIYAGLVLFLMPVIFSLFSTPLHNFSKYGKDFPADFNSFLASCTDLERIRMLQALQDFPSRYNTANPADVKRAVNAGNLEASSISCEAVRKAIVYRSYNKATYYFRGHDEIAYHDIVQWAAGKTGVSDKMINTLSTYRLEQEVSQKFFSKVWDSLSPEQKEKIIHDLNLKRTWNISLIEVAQKVYELVKDPLSLVVSILGSTAGYAFAESDTVCMFIMTVSMIKSKG